MSKKKKSSSFKLDLTGKMTILIELDGYGPLQINVNNKDTVVEVIRMLLDMGGSIMDVDSYDKKTQKKFEKLLGEVK
jgi:hypothetical protein